MQHKHNMAEMAAQLTKPFQMVVVEQVDDYSAILTRVEGSYIFHQHPRDEMYLVLEGEIVMDYPVGSSITVKQGESLVAQGEEKHRSRSDDGALVLIFRHRDTVYGPGRLGRIKDAIRSNLPSIRDNLPSIRDSLPLRRGDDD